MSRTMKAEGTSLFSVYAENAAPFQLEYYKKGGCKENEIKIIGDFIFTDSETMGSFASERFEGKKLMRLLADNGFPEVKIKRLADFSYLAYARKK